MPWSWIRLPPNVGHCGSCSVPPRSVHRRIHNEVFRRLVRREFLNHSALAAD
jgi:hypothetical protein